MGGRSGSPEGAAGIAGEENPGRGTARARSGSGGAPPAISVPARRQAPGPQSGIGQQPSSQGASPGGGAGGAWQGMGADSALAGTAAAVASGHSEASGTVASDTASTRRQSIGSRETRDLIPRV